MDIEQSYLQHQQREQNVGINLPKPPSYHKLNSTNNGNIADPNVYKFPSRFAHVYGMNYQNQYLIKDLRCGTAIDQTDLIYKVDVDKNPEMENLSFPTADKPYYAKKKRTDVLSILGFLLMILAICACIALVVLPSYFLYCMISMEKQQIQIIPAKPKAPIFIQH